MGCLDSQVPGLKSEANPYELPPGLESVCAGKGSSLVSAGTSLFQRRTSIRRLAEADNDIRNGFECSLVAAHARLSKA